ncbi:MAG: translational GTPase TypA, partial [Planctomycetes bacterium]|nr:translational GTPase TypA [Planctomycetota bacterium]
HADFGGEVERILGMIDGVLLLVDASEGPMPQTKFVLAKTLALGLKPIVMINKVDKPDARANEVHGEVFDLFALLDASDEQLDFPVLFGSAKHGWAASDADQPSDDMTALFEQIIAHVPPPTVVEGEPFRMLVSNLEADPYLGRILTGRILSGSVKPNMTAKALAQNGDVIEQVRITKVLGFRGLSRSPLDEAHGGDIVAVAGFNAVKITKQTPGQQYIIIT